MYALCRHYDSNCLWNLKIDIIVIQRIQYSETFSNAVRKFIRIYRSCSFYISRSQPPGSNPKVFFYFFILYGYMCCIQFFNLIPNALRWKSVSAYLWDALAAYTVKRQSVMNITMGKLKHLRASMWNHSQKSGSLYTERRDLPIPRLFL
jgi:hypothetical protein